MNSTLNINDGVNSIRDLEMMQKLTRGSHDGRRSGEGNFISAASFTYKVQTNESGREVRKLSFQFHNMNSHGPGSYKDSIIQTAKHVNFVNNPICVTLLLMQRKRMVENAADIYLYSRENGTEVVQQF